MVPRPSGVPPQRCAHTDFSSLLTGSLIQGHPSPECHLLRADLQCPGGAWCPGGFGGKISGTDKRQHRERERAQGAESKPPTWPRFPFPCPGLSFFICQGGRRRARRSSRCSLTLTRIVPGTERAFLYKVSGLSQRNVSRRTALSAESGTENALGWERQLCHVLCLERGGRPQAL